MSAGVSCGRSSSRASATSAMRHRRDPAGQLAEQPLLADRRASGSRRAITVLEVLAPQLRVAGQRHRAHPPAGEHRQHPLDPASDQGHHRVPAATPRAAIAPESPALRRDQLAEVPLAAVALGVDRDDPELRRRGALHHVLDEVHAVSLPEGRARRRGGRQRSSRPTRRRRGPSEAVARIRACTGAPADLHRRCRGGPASPSAELAGHPVEEGGDARERTEEDGDLPHQALVVEPEQVDSLELGSLDLAAEVKDVRIAGYLIEVLERPEDLEQDSEKIAAPRLGRGREHRRSESGGRHPARARARCRRDRAPRRRRGSGWWVVATAVSAMD